MRSTDPLYDFLETASGREVALAVAEDENELKEFSRRMNELGFKEAETVPDLLSRSKSYIVAKEGTGKNIYDFAVQYPTGQVEVFNKDEMQSRVLSPDYENKAVLLISEKDLSKLLAGGLDLLSATGPVYRS